MKRYPPFFDGPLFISGAPLGVAPEREIYVRFRIVAVSGGVITSSIYLQNHGFYDMVNPLVSDGTHTYFFMYIDRNKFDWDGIWTHLSSVTATLMQPVIVPLESTCTLNVYAVTALSNYTYRVKFRIAYLGVEGYGYTPGTELFINLSS